MIRKIAWVLLAACSLACSGGSGGSGAGAGAGAGAGTGTQPGPGVQGGDYCSTACAKLEQCDPSGDQQTCTASCQNEMAVVGSKLRADYLAYVGSCFSAKDCATVLQGDAASLCAEEASATFAPSASAITFCDGLVGAANNCGGSAEKGACLESVKQYSDATLVAAKACLSKACTEIDTCVAAELGIETSSSGGTGSNTCAYAFDGYCDEPEYCEYGTDSYDCG